MNLYHDGKLSGKHLLGFVCFSLCYFCIQNLAFLTMYFANRANINVGLITTIWSVNPLFLAFMDSLIFGQKLQYFHHIGMIAIVICTIALSLSGVISPKTETAEVDLSNLLPTWIPVLFGIITPMAFTANGMIIKSLTSERMGFNPSNLSFGAYFIVNCIVMVGAVYYWINYEFDSYLLIVGLIGSMINTCGIALIQNALATGPAGPASALASASNILLVIVEAIKTGVMLSFLEFVGLILGTFGSLILVIPEQFEVLYYKLTCRKPPSKATSHEKEENLVGDDD